MENNAVEPKPKAKMSKKQTFGCCGVLVLIVIIIVIIIVSVSGGNASSSNKSAKSVQASGPIDQFPHTKALLASMQNSDGKTLLKNFTYAPAVQGINDDPRINVDLNYGETDEGNSIQIKQDMASVVKAVLHDDNANVNEVWVTAYGPFVDKYGKTSTDILYQIYFNKSDANQINWNTDDQTLELTIIPGLWHVNANNLSN